MRGEKSLRTSLFISFLGDWFLNTNKYSKILLSEIYLSKCHIYSIEMYLNAFISFGTQKDESEVSQKYPDVAFRRSTDKAVLSRIDSQCFDWRVVGLEALALVLVGKLQDADPALPSACDKQLLPVGHREHGGTGLLAAKS